MTLDVQWFDGGRKAQCAPNPAFPRGIDIDMTKGAKVACFTDLPYPAKRIGYFVITCAECDYKSVVTTAGRPDDPRSVKVPCKRKGAR